MEIVDTQIHLFAPDAAEYARRIGQQVVAPEQIISEMDAAGVAKAYLVPAGSSAANAACTDAAARWPDRFRVMGRISLDKPEGHALMERWPEAAPFVGFRLPFPPTRSESWITNGTADWFWKAANEYRLPLMIWAPGQAAAIANAAERHPQARFILDHMNLFVHDKGVKAEKAVQAILPLARIPNIAVKASSLPSHSVDAYPFKDTHTWVRRVVDTFGSNRVMWGTDLTRRTCSYNEAIRMFAEELHFLSSTELSDIMGKSALNWIGW